jgi:hypothetical protein
VACFTGLAVADLVSRWTHERLLIKRCGQSVSPLVGFANQFSN